MDRLMSMRVFERVLVEGSFAAAARALDMSPAVVTRLVADLETHLGARLLQRSTRKLALTEAGEQYLGRVRAILQDIDDAEALASAHTQQARGVLRVLAQPLMATHVLAPLAADFMRRFPGIVLELSVRAFDTPPVEDYDVTVFAAPAAYNGEIIARKIIGSQAILVASPAYLQAHGSLAGPQELQQHQFLQFKSNGLIPPLESLCRAEDPRQTVEVKVNAALRSNHIDTLLRAALEGAGITGASVELVAPYLASGALVRVLPEWILGELVMYAAMPSRQFVPQRTRVFVDYLSEWTQAQVHQAQRGMGCARTAATPASASLMDTLKA
ncbi:MAG: LysR family transcriptional regulator [Rhodoferax sp.]